MVSFAQFVEEVVNKGGGKNTEQILNAHLLEYLKSERNDIYKEIMFLNGNGITYKYCSIENEGRIRVMFNVSPQDLNWRVSFEEYLEGTKRKLDQLRKMKSVLSSLKIGTFHFYSDRGNGYIDYEI